MIKFQKRLCIIINEYIHYLIFLFVSILILLDSPLSPITGGHLSYDSGVYLYTGWMMTKGYLPYLEVWDNKGLIMYLINMIGIIINYEYGLWLIEIISLLICSIIMYKTFLMFTSKLISIISTLYIMITIGGLLWGGNYTEEFALPFSFLAVYIFTKSFVDDIDLKNYHSIILGVTFAATLLLRPNIAVVWPAFFLVYSFNMYYKKKFERLICNYIFFIFGMGLVFSPFMYYLFHNGIVGDFINATLLVPISFEKMVFQQRFSAVLKLLYTLNMFSGILIISICWFFISTFLIFKKKTISYGLKLVYYSIAVAFFVNSYANSISGYAYVHYTLTFIPIISLPSMFVFDFSIKWLKKINSARYKSLELIYISFILILILTNSVQRQNIQYEYNQKQIYSLRDYILKNTSEEDKIQIFSSQTELYYKTKRKAASKYFYVLTNGVLEDKFEEQMLYTIYKDIMDQKPKIIIVSKKYEVYINNEETINKSSYEKFLKSNYFLDVTENEDRIYLKKN